MKVCHAESFSSHLPSSRSQLQVVGVFLYKWCVYSNSKTAEANLINFIERSTKVRKYVTQNFGSDYPGRGHNQVSSSLAIT